MLALKLLAGIAPRTCEPALCKTGAQPSFTPQRLNLSIPEASQLKKLISHVVAQYELDVPAQVPPHQSRHALAQLVVMDALEPEMRVELQLDEAELSAKGCNEELSTFEAVVNTYQRGAFDNYSTVSATIVVDDGADTERGKISCSSCQWPLKRSASCS